MVRSEGSRKAGASESTTALSSNDRVIVDLETPVFVQFYNRVSVIPLVHREPAGRQARQTPHVPRALIGPVCHALDIFIGSVEVPAHRVDPGTLMEYSRHVHDSRAYPVFVSVNNAELPQHDR